MKRTMIKRIPPEQVATLIELTSDFFDYEYDPGKDERAEDVEKLHSRA